MGEYIMKITTEFSCNIDTSFNKTETIFKKLFNDFPERLLDFPHKLNE
jgi:hypothetical protein